jgi:putative oxidoreductase
MNQNSSQANLALLAARVLLALLFVMGGWSKLMAPAGGAGYIASVGLPGWLIYPAIVAELGGGLLILIGFQTRLVALFMALFTVFLALVFHNYFSLAADDKMFMFQYLNFYKNLGMAGGFFALVASGAGAWSVDRA